MAVEDSTQGKNEPIPVTESDNVPAAALAAPQSATPPDAKATPQAEANQDAPAPDAEPAKPAEPQKKSDSQRRIDRLTRNWRGAERDAAYQRGRAEAAERELETVRKGSSPAKSPTPASSSADEPKVEDFDNLKDWSRAYTAWEAGQAAPKGKDEPAAPETPPTEGKDETPALEIKVTPEHKASLDRAREAHDDFDEVIADVAGQLPASALVAAHDYPNAPELLYALAQEGDLKRFQGMTDRQVMREVWKFAEQHQPAANSSETPPATANGSDSGVPRTKTPEPAASRAGPVPTTLSGAAPSNRSLEDLASNDIGSFIARRNAEDKKAGYG